VFERVLCKHYTFSASGFYDRMDNLVSQVLDPSTGYQTTANVADVRARGMEFEFAGKYASGVEGRASYSVQDAVDQHSGQFLTNSPKHLGKVNLIVPLRREKLFAGVDAQYTSPRKTLGGDWQGGFPMVNLTLFNTRLFPHVDLSASLYNLFDKKYADPGGAEHLQDSLRQDGRSFRVKVTWRWEQR
jgi:outer membrane receptor for ferrienterochelin and colicins